MNKRSAGWGIFTLLMFSATAVLVVFLLGECSAGSGAIEAYIGSVRSGERVSEAVGGAEAEALTALLGRTSSISVKNFLGQAGTSCYWTSLHHSGGSTPARFLLEEAEDGGVRVIGASLERECSCPEDFEQRCHLD